MRSDIPVRATQPQVKFAELMGVHGYNQGEAAKIAFPNSKNPGNAATQALRSATVQKMIVRHQLNGIKMEASGVAYAFHLLVIKDEVTYKDPETGKTVHEHAKIPERQKSADSLHNNFGFGRVKPKKGEDPFDAPDSTEEDLTDFIEETTAALKALEQGPNEEEEAQMLEEIDEDSETYIPSDEEIQNDPDFEVQPAEEEPIKGDL